MGRAQMTGPLREAYLDVVDPRTFEGVHDIAALPGQDTFTAIGSAWLGSTRLIDNVPLVVPAVPPAGVLHASVSP
jgi:pantothenate synthetase